MTVAISPDDIRLFYERLFVWNIIRPNGEDRSDPRRSKWQRCLDSLALLCDTHVGGKTVSAIVVQDKSDELCYWIACNDHTRVADDFLRWLLKTLKSLHSAEDLNQPREQILRKAVQRCEIRIKNYSRILGSIIKDLSMQVLSEGMAKDEMPHSRLTEDTEEISLLARLSTMLPSTEDLVEICAAAYGFRHDEMSQEIKSIIAARSNASLWQKIRHYLGRLGAWPQAITFIVQYWPTDARLNRPSTVQAISEPTALTWVYAKNLERTAILQKTMPIENLEREPPHVRERYRQLEQNILQSTSESNAPTRVHAESALVDYITQLKDFRFLGGERYVGVSKPSCYCCNVYLALHPLGLVPRKSHNNIYIKWSPLVLKTLEDGRVVVTVAFNSLSESLLADIQRAVSGSDNLEELMSCLDSTTDLTSSHWLDSVLENRP
jgi:hypothetical protein